MILNRRDFLKTSGLAFGSLALKGCASSYVNSSSGYSERPNIIFIMSDDHACPEKYSELYVNDLPEPDTFGDDYASRSKALTEECRYSKMVNIKKSDLSGNKPPAGLTGDNYKKWVYQTFLKGYLRVIAAMDDSIGRLLDYIDSSGLAENTVVVYTSDNGFFLGDHGFYNKMWMYEQSLHIPFIEELYDMSVDPGQEKDIAKAHPRIVDQLRREYECYWSDVTKGNVGYYGRPILGSPHQPEVTLCAEDWMPSKSGENSPWSQAHILQVSARFGFWPVEIAVDGTYRVELRRWPREAHSGFDVSRSLAESQSTRTTYSFYSPALNQLFLNNSPTSRQSNAAICCLFLPQGHTALV